MKKVIKILPLLLLVACGGPKIEGELADLHSKRDSLQNVQTEIEKQLINLEVQIAELDPSINPDDLKIIKKISMQKSQIAKFEKKIKELENTMTAREEKNLIPVAVKEMVGEKFDHYIVTYGEVEAENYARISPEMGGRIEKIHVERGQRVAEGQLLVSLNTDAVDKQIEGVKSGLEFATKTFEKQDALWKQNIGSEIEYLSAKNTKEGLESQLEALQAQKRMAQIRAPFAGIVDKIYPKEGEMAGPSFPVIEFVNLSILTIKADVSETHIDQIKKGQHVGLSFSSLPNLDEIDVPIIRVSNVIESASRTFEIEMNLKNPGERIKPNMVSTIRINDYSFENAFVIPSLAIRQDITGNYVYVVSKKDGEDIIAKKYIKTGLSYEEKTMVKEGLSKGDKVVVKGFHLVSTGIPVNVVK